MSSLRLERVGIDLPDRTLLDAIDLTVSPGQRLAVIGENGAGKSTLLAVAAGLRVPDRGRVQRHGRVAYLPQWLDDDAPGSGGERQRRRLEGVHAADAELILLDEPTHHLDGDRIAWLESWLLASRAAILLVAHDRAFLDTVATDVAFLERGRVMPEAGGYREASERRAAADEAHLRRHRAHVRRQRALWDAVQRERSRARSAGRFDHRKADGQATVLVKNRAEAVSRTLAKRARAMEGRLRRDAVPDKPFEDHRRVAFVAAPADPGPSEVVRASGLTVRRGGRTVVGGLDLFIRRGERVAVMGPNGSGKTTLLEVLAGMRPPDGGEVRHGRGLRIAVVTQAYEPWRGAETVGDALRRFRSRLSGEEVWRVTAQAGIPSPPDRPVAELSGGERRRLTLACVAVTDAHLLVLDEPTHHLDLRAVEALEGLLQGFAGTLLLASHDRCLVEAVASRVWRLDQVAGLDAGGAASP